MAGERNGQLTSVEKVHYEVELVRGLEGIVQLHDKRMLDLLEDLALRCIKTQIELGRS